MHIGQGTGLSLIYKAFIFYHMQMKNGRHFFQANYGSCFKAFLIIKTDITAKNGKKWNIIKNFGILHEKLLL